MSRILSFQHAINIKNYWHSTVFGTRSLKSGVCLMDSAPLTVDVPHVPVLPRIRWCRSVLSACDCFYLGLKDIALL